MKYGFRKGTYALSITINASNSPNELRFIKFINQCHCSRIRTTAWVGIPGHVRKLPVTWG